MSQAGTQQVEVGKHQRGGELGLEVADGGRACGGPTPGRVVLEESPQWCSGLRIVG